MALGVGGGDAGRPEALRFLFLLLVSLGAFEIGGDGGQNAGGMVAQYSQVKIAGRWDLTRKFNPICKNGVSVLLNEVRKRHA